MVVIILRTLAKHGETVLYLSAQVTGVEVYFIVQHVGVHHIVASEDETRNPKVFVARRR